MTEFILFLIVAVLAVASAAMMLLNENAVYSALSLIVTMGCIAFLFLLLEAPFLAMIQITVYAGAIMVLFVFVIMLLGAERVGSEPSKFRWLTPLAIGLSFALLLVVGIAVAGGQVDSQEAAPQNPGVRVVNAITGAREVDIYANDVLLASGLDFDETSNFVYVPPGEYQINVSQPDGELMALPVTLDADTMQTLVAYGEAGDTRLQTIFMDMSAPLTRYSRVTFGNVYPGMDNLSVIDLGLNQELDVNETGSVLDRILVEDLDAGAVAEPVLLEQGRYNWAFVAPDGDIVSRVVGTTVGRSDYELERETNDLVLLTAERSIIDDTVNPVSTVTVISATAAFGGPEAIGMELFTRYLLPFELVALVLLASMIGAIVLTHREEAPVRDRAAGRRRVSRPLANVIASQVGHDVTTRQETPALPPEQGQPAGD